MGGGVYVSGSLPPIVPPRVLPAATPTTLIEVPLSLARSAARAKVRGTPAAPTSRSVAATGHEAGGIGAGGGATQASSTGLKVNEAEVCAPATPAVAASASRPATALQPP